VRNSCILRSAAKRSRYAEASKVGYYPRSRPVRHIFPLPALSKIVFVSPNMWLRVHVFANFCGNKTVQKL
jgi:hypothetical protein